MSWRPLKRMVTWFRPQQQQQQPLWPQTSLLDLPTELQNIILLEAVVATSRDPAVYVEDVVTSLCLVCRRWLSIIDCRYFDRELRRQLACMNPTYRYRIEVKQLSSIDDKPLPKNRPTCVHDSFLFAVSDCRTSVEVYKLDMKKRLSIHIGTVHLFAPNHQPTEIMQLQACTAADGSLQLYSMSMSIITALPWLGLNFVRRTTILHDTRLTVDLRRSTVWQPTNYGDMKINDANGDVVVYSPYACIADVYSRDGVLRTSIDLNDVIPLSPPELRFNVQVVPADGPNTYVVKAVYRLYVPPAPRGFWRTLWDVLRLYVPMAPMTTHTQLRLLKIRQSPASVERKLEILSDVREDCEDALETSDPDCPLLLAVVAHDAVDKQLNIARCKLTVRRLDADLNVLPGIGVMHIELDDNGSLQSFPIFDPQSKSFFV